MAACAGQTVVARNIAPRVSIRPKPNVRRHWTKVWIDTFVSNAESGTNTFLMPMEETGFVAVDRNSSPRQSWTT
jgi:hypothetical protein